MSNLGKRESQVSARRGASDDLVGLSAPTVTVHSIGRAGRTYRGRQSSIVALSFGGMLAATIVGVRGMQDGTLEKPALASSVGIVWFSYGAGRLMLSKIQRRTCPHCMKFLPSSQDWRCPVCDARHTPPTGPTMFDGCSTCHRYPSMYQCPHCAHYINLDQNDVINVQECATAADRSLRHPIDQVTETLTKHVANKEAKVKLIETEIHGVTASEQYERLMYKRTHGAGAAAARDQEETLDVAEGKRGAIRKRYEKRRRAIEEDETLLAEELRAELKKLRSEEDDAYANAAL